MIAPNSIPDVYILDLERKGERLVILHESNHLLRRFGQVEYVRMKAGEEMPFSLRIVADEIWSLVSGESSLILVDKRQGSPSEGKIMEVKLASTQPQAVLIPFGVAYQIKTAKDSQFIRITTHIDGINPEDRFFTPDEINTIDSIA